MVLNFESTEVKPIIFSLVIEHSYPLREHRNDSRSFAGKYVPLHTVACARNSASLFIGASRDGTLVGRVM